MPSTGRVTENSKLSPLVKVSWLVKQMPTAEISFTRQWKMSDCEASARLIATGMESLYRRALRRSCIVGILGTLGQDPVAAGIQRQCPLRDGQSTRNALTLRSCVRFAGPFLCRKLRRQRELIGLEEFGCVAQQIL